MSNITTSQGFAPTTLTEAMQFSEMLAKSSMVPRAYQGKAEDVLVAMQWGREIGLAPLQALQNIAVINGKPSVYGDAAMALVQASSVCEGIEETIEGEGTPNPVAVCVAHRKGRSPVVAKFSVEDAKRAGLWGKQGPWQAYPKRMLQMRARGFALRDAFPDVLKGLITSEEAQDFPAEQPAKDITPKKKAAQAIGHNPLDAIQAPVQEVPLVLEVVEPVLEEQPEREYVEVEQANQAIEEAIAEAVDDALEEHGVEVVEGYVLRVPGREDQVFETKEAWGEAYEELADKVATAGKASTETRTKKLEELREVNQRMFDRMDPLESIKHSKRASARRDKLA